MIRERSKIITLIGMSGSGKSYWSKKLETQGFFRVCIDDEIEKKLAPVLAKNGYRGIRDVAKWLGEPYEPQFKRNQKEYLRYEQEVMEEVIAQTLNPRGFKIFSSNIVIDTTGSVIYTGKKVCGMLRKQSTVVYLDTPREVQDAMLKLYLDDPKPVLWGNQFNRRAGENAKDALARFYPKLLAWRSRQYKKYADVTLDYYKLRSPDFCVENFYEILQYKK